MLDDEKQALSARMDGLQIVVSMVLNMLPDQEAVEARLRLLEETARQRNMDSETIAVLREFREAWGQQRGA